MRRINILARTWKTEGPGRIMITKEGLFKELKAYMELASKSGFALNPRDETSVEACCTDP